MVFGETDHHQTVEDALHGLAQRRHVDAAVAAEGPRIRLRLRDDVLRQPLAPLVDEGQVGGVHIFAVALAVQPIQLAAAHRLVGKLPKEIEFVEIGARALEGEHQPVAAGIEEAQALEVGEDGPRAAVAERVVDRLLLFLGAVGRHAGQRHLPRRHHPFQRVAHLRQLADHAETLRFDENHAALFGDQRHVGTPDLGVQLVFVAGGIVDGPAQRSQQRTDELVHHPGLADGLAGSVVQLSILLDEIGDGSAGVRLGWWHSNSLVKRETSNVRSQTSSVGVKRDNDVSMA